MRLTLRARLILSYLAVACLTIAVVSLYVRYTSEERLREFAADQQTAGALDAARAYYIENGGWQGLYDPSLPSVPTPAGERGRGGAHNEALPGAIGLVDADYRAIIPALGYGVGELVPREQIISAAPVVVDGTTVGWLLPELRSGSELSLAEQDFLARTSQALLLAGLVGLLGAVLMGVALSGAFLRPVRSLMHAAQQLEQGHLRQEVPVVSDDELGQLSRAFNQMSAELARADDQRRQMTADITHDLSTPLQVIAGYMEMLEDDRSALTPQRARIVMTEVERLRRLVADLGTLVQADGGALDIQRQPLAPHALLESVLHSFEGVAHRQGVIVRVDASPDLPLINADEDRMMQVLANLVDNALRHTPAGGEVRLAAQSAGASVSFLVQDNGSGIDAEDLPYVFDRFYRTDRARGGASGKMGLGLAIARALVAAQDGEITIDSAGRGRGTTAVVRFKSL